MGAMANKYDLKFLNYNFIATLVVVYAIVKAADWQSFLSFFSHRNRKKIANYKVAASLAQKSGDDELHIISPLRDDSSKPPPSSPDRLLLGNKPSSSNGEVNELRAGNIVVTWKDGNTSCLYSNPEAQEEEQEGKQEEEQEEKPEVVSAAEL